MLLKSYKEPHKIAIFTGPKFSNVGNFILFKVIIPDTVIDINVRRAKIWKVFRFIKWT